MRTHTHTRKCSITHSSVATMVSNRKKMDNESVKEIQAPDRKMDIIMHDLAMTICNTPKARVTNSINYMKNRNKKDKNSKYKNKLENKP